MQNSKVFKKATDDVLQLVADRSKRFGTLVAEGKTSLVGATTAVVDMLRTMHSVLDQTMYFIHCASMHEGATTCPENSKCQFSHFSFWFLDEFTRPNMPNQAQLTTFDTQTRAGVFKSLQSMVADPAGMVDTLLALQGLWMLDNRDPKEVFNFSTRAGQNLPTLLRVCHQLVSVARVRPLRVHVWDNKKAKKEPLWTNKGLRVAGEKPGKPAIYLFPAGSKFSADEETNRPILVIDEPIEGFYNGGGLCAKDLVDLLVEEVKNTRDRLILDFIMTQ